MRKKIPEPTRASLRALPEVDLSALRRLPRGKYYERARRSFAIALIEPDLFAQFGSSEAVSAALRAVVDASKTVRETSSSKRKSRRSGRIARKRAA